MRLSAEDVWHGLSQEEQDFLFRVEIYLDGIRVHYPTMVDDDLGIVKFFLMANQPEVHQRWNIISVFDKSDGSPIYTAYGRVEIVDPICRPSND